MELLDASRSIVVVVDIQGKLVDQVHRPALVLAATRRLLAVADLFGIPVLLTEQYPRGLGPTHPDVLAAYEALAVPKRRIEKSAFGCAGDAGFEAALDELRPRGAAPRQVVIAGIEAHVCVMQTAIELRRRGEQVHLCWECVSGRGAEYRENALARMTQAGAVLTNHESAGFEWARHKDHARFKAFSALLKEGQIG